MKTSRIAVIALSAVASLSCASGPPQATLRSPATEARIGAELVVSWNDRVLTIGAAEDGLLTLKTLRTLTMMHLAVHDALSVISGRFEVYGPVDSQPDAAPLAAAAQAAFDVAVAQYPDQRPVFEAERDRWLARVNQSRAKMLGVELGHERARAIVSVRDGDGWNTEAEYRWHPMAPGVYAQFAEHSGTPTGFIFGAAWGMARPFALERADQFRVPPPPMIDSAAYTEAFDEVREVGRHVSGTRTGDQAHLAMWWKDFVENSHNRLARQLVLAESLDLAEAARLFALLNVAIYDGYVASFADKFHYNHWRPYTAIRWAEHDGNPDTAPEIDWDNLHRHTYPFPSYPSAHGTVCAAAAGVLSETFGEDHAFTMTTAEVDQAGPFSGKVAMEPPTRTFPSFAAAAEECALSRVYLGIHFRYDSTEGNRLGKRVGGWVVESLLRPVH